MSDTGGQRTPAPKQKPAGARPASSMRDGVTARTQDGGSVAKVASDEEDLRAADKAKPNDTVRIRTSAADQPWKQPAKDGDKPEGRTVTGAEPTAQFSRPAGVRPPSAAGSPSGAPARPAAPSSPSGTRPTGGNASAVRPGGAPGARPAGSGGAGGPGSPSGPGGSGARPGGAPSGASSPLGRQVAGFPTTPSPADDAAPSGLPESAVRGLGFGTSERPGMKTESGQDKKDASRGPRKAHLVLRRVEPWSAMKFSFVVSLVCFVVLFVAVAVLYGVLSGLGVFSAITDVITQLTSGGEPGKAGAIDASSWFTPVRILGYAALLGAVNVVLITALSTLGAVIYNISAGLVGGIEVTFSEAE